MPAGAPSLAPAPAPAPALAPAPARAGQNHEAPRRVHRLHRGAEMAVKAMRCCASMRTHPSALHPVARSHLPGLGGTSAMLFITLSPLGSRKREHVASKELGLAGPVAATSEALRQAPARSMPINVRRLRLPSGITPSCAGFGSTVINAAQCKWRPVARPMGQVRTSCRMPGRNSLISLTVPRHPQLMPSGQCGCVDDVGDVGRARYPRRGMYLLGRRAPRRDKAQVPTEVQVRAPLPAWRRAGPADP